jgi:anti-anti-sigma factor
MGSADPVDNLLVQHLGSATIITFTQRRVDENFPAIGVSQVLTHHSPDSGCGQLVVNLGIVEQVSSAGLSRLLALHHEVQNAGGQLTLCNLQPAIQEILQATRLDQVFSLHTGPPCGSAPIDAAAEPSSISPVAETSAPEAPVETVALCHPKNASGRKLCRVLGDAFRVVQVAELSELAESAEPLPPVAVLPLRWNPAGRDRSAHLNDSLQQYLDEHGRQQSVILYGDLSDFPLPLYIRTLDIGARQILDNTSAQFTDELRSNVTRALRQRREQAAERDELQDFFRQLGLIAESEAMMQVFQRVATASKTNDMPVLLEGETGTGKERLARAIHLLDPKRCRGPFMAINCGAISKSLAESELFGHKKGAFSGADSERLGIFRAASGGTLLLDEIGELEPDLQPKLLRVLQERRLLPLGTDYESSIDIRIIAATNRSLKWMVETGQFRRDLYERLNGYPIFIPPLRERPQDIVVQARYFLHNQADRETPSDLDFSPRVLELLRALPWEGNTRQLENFIRATLADKPLGPLIQVEDLPRRMLYQMLEKVPPTSSAEHSRYAGHRDNPQPSHAAAPLKQLSQLVRSGNVSLDDALSQLERQLLEETLRRNQGNQSRTAEELGLNRRTLFNKLKKHCLD